MSASLNSDFLVIGGGIVGLATAYQLSKQFPEASLCLLEKEPAVAQHQSGRNSGVLHSGIYYKPGSLKATTCRAGKLAMEAFCSEQGIAFERCGKIIVALDDTEEARLQAIYERGQANGIHCKIIDRAEILQLEPHSAGQRAIHVPESGIVDYPGVCERFAQLLRNNGQHVRLSEQVQRITQRANSVEVETHGNKYEAGFLITCGGLYSDHLVKLSGLKPPAQIVPFRGEYFELDEAARGLCRNLIYPVPDPNFPFLGVHFTRMVSGDVECGPNAVFALAREGYSWGTLRFDELAESLFYGGFLKLAARNWKMGLGEIHRSLSKAAFVKALQRLIPDIRSEHLKPCRAGVRAQAIAPDGSMIDDFLWVVEKRMIHVCNAPSPAATASLEIGRQIVSRVCEQLE
jgi:(S)-2-hydroxyglutarate dehydrogenase